MRVDSPFTDEVARSKLTFRLELRRSCLAGILETAGGTFLLLIAVRWFDSSSLAKGILSAANSFGYLMAPLIVWATRRIGLRTNQATALLFAMSGFALTIALTGSQFGFLIGATCAGILAASTVPLVTSIYQHNYQKNERGKLLGRCFMLRVALVMIGSHLIGRFLNVRLDQWWLVVSIYVLCYLWSGALLYRYPGHALSLAPLAGMREAFRSASTDILFRNTLIAWMFLGFGNLMMQPLRIEYLANPAYGITLSNADIAFYCGVVPSAVRLLFNPFWGYLFDRINFFVLRIILNLGFLSGIGAFFFTPTPLGFLCGSLLLGIAASGGDVAWNLWVTKFAPPEKVPGYMAVHTFFTGMRGVVAPIVGFLLLDVISIRPLSWIAMFLIAIATTLFFVEVAKGRTLPDVS